jgi:hypothetical protein
MLIISGSLALPGNHFAELIQQLTCLAFSNQSFLGHLEKYQDPSMQCREKHCSNWLTPHSAPQSCYRILRNGQFFKAPMGAAHLWSGRELQV